MSREYSNPDFTAVPMATLCSKSGCATGSPIAISRTIGSLSQTPDPLIILPDDLKMRADEDMLYIFEPSVQLVFELNGTGSFIIRSIDTGARVSALLDLVRTSYELVPSDAGDYLWGFLLRLEASGFRLRIVE